MFPPVPAVVLNAQANQQQQQPQQQVSQVSQLSRLSSGPLVKEENMEKAEVRRARRCVGKAATATSSHTPVTHPSTRALVRAAFVGGLGTPPACPALAQASRPGPHPSRSPGLTRMCVCVCVCVTLTPFCV